MSFIQKDYARVLNKDALSLNGARKSRTNLVTGRLHPERKKSFRLHFLNNNIDQLDSCAGSSQVRVCVKTLIRSARIHSYRESKILDVLKNGKQQYKLGK